MKNKQTVKELVASALSDVEIQSYNRALTKLKIAEKLLLLTQYLRRVDEWKKRNKDG